MQSWQYRGAEGQRSQICSLVSDNRYHSVETPVPRHTQTPISDREICSIINEPRRTEATRRGYDRRRDRGFWPLPGFLPVLRGLPGAVR